ncbi:hypothetical protein Tco_0809796 [Tanacetum coccineum]
MDDPNITMEEYIRLEEEKARRHGRTFNWQTATFGKVKNYEDEEDHPINFETEFPTIFFDNTLTAIQSGPTGWFSYKHCGGQDMAPLPAADQRHPWLRYQIEEYTKGIRHSYEKRLETIWIRPVNQVHVLDFEGLTAEMRQVPTVRVSDTVMDLDINDTLCFQLGGVRRRMTWRQFILALGLHTELEMAKAGFGAYWAGSDRLIPDKEGQAPEKVTGIDLFYLRSMDCGTINVPHLLAQYLFRHAEGRKSGARLSGGNFIGRLAMHFGLVTHGPERQQAAAAGANEADEAGHAAEKAAPKIPAPAPA